MAEFLMPQLGSDMTEGTLVAWRKKPGEPIRRGEIIADVETDKGVIEVECFHTGVVEKLLVQPGVKAPVGAALATIREEGASVSAAAPTQPPPTVTAQPVHPRVSPAARKRAQELGIDVATLSGSGPGGAITIDDVERGAAGKPVPTAAADRSARMRQAIATTMSRSKREIPHYYLSNTIDLHRAMTWLEAENERRPVTERLLPGVLFVKAVALALRAFPDLNAAWENNRAIPRPSINVGVAITLRQGGLVAPALLDVDRQPLGELMQNFRDLVNRARTGTLRSSDLTNATITITSLGDQGVEAVFGIIYPPQVALVGFGRIVERPWVVDGKVVPRPVVTATLSADHRASDGQRGALYLAAVDRLLQEPEKL